MPGNPNLNFSNQQLTKVSLKQQMFTWSEDTQVWMKCMWQLLSGLQVKHESNLMDCDNLHVTKTIGLRNEPEFNYKKKICMVVGLKTRETA
jgi:hypothetical protein